MPLNNSALEYALICFRLIIHFGVILCDLISVTKLGSVQQRPCSVQRWADKIINRQFFVQLSTACTCRYRLKHEHTLFVTYLVR